MKKKLVLLMLLGTSLVCASCGASDTEVEEAQVTEAVTITEAITDEEAENQSVTETPEDTTAVQESENTDIQKEDSKENEEAVINEAKLEQMLNDTLNWVGLQYTYLENSDIQELTAAQAIPMACNAVGATQQDLEQDEEYNLIIPENVLEDTMKNLFGTVYDTSEYTPGEYDMVRQAEDGSLRLVQGDWGTAGPGFSVQTIEKDTSSNKYIATVNYFTNYWDEDRSSETEYVVYYYLTPDAESTYGFLITNMVGEKPAASTKEQIAEVSQEGYTDEELCNMAREYYTAHNNYTPSVVEVDSVTEDGKVLIHLYDIMEDHTATSDWYLVDRVTAKGTNILEEKINLAE